MQTLAPPEDRTPYCPPPGASRAETCAAFDRLIACEWALRHPGRTLPAA